MVQHVGPAHGLVIAVLARVLPLRLFAHVHQVMSHVALSLVDLAAIRALTATHDLVDVAHVELHVLGMLRRELAHGALEVGHLAADLPVQKETLTLEDQTASLALSEGMRLSMVTPKSGLVLGHVVAVVAMIGLVMLEALDPVGASIVQAEVDATGGDEAAARTAEVRLGLAADFTVLEDVAADELELAARAVLEVALLFGLDDEALVAAGVLVLDAALQRLEATSTSRAL